MKYDYKNRLSVSRENSSTVKRPAQIDEFYSDRSRVLYCSSFRRLQQSLISKWGVMYVVR